jgi:hypothetical protein
MMNRRDLTPLALPWHSHSALLLLLLLLLPALTACEKPATSRSSDAQHVLPMEAPEAAQMARTLANQQALALYRCEPFVNGPSAVWTNEHWLWRARQGLGDGDMEAVVSLAADGSTQSVQVLLLHSSLRE